MLDAPGIIKWVRSAKPGDAAVYARGETVARQVSAAAIQLQSQGLVDLTRRREGRGWSFIIQRRSKPFKQSEGRRPRHRYGRASAETIILRMIREAIRRKEPCPTNIEFAEAAGLSGALAASYRLRKLVADGKIALMANGHDQRRVAVLVETGEMTVEAPL